jgi:Ca-activated chloride channel family protein
MEVIDNESQTAGGHSMAMQHERVKDVGCGMLIKGAQDTENVMVLPLQEVKVDIKIMDSIAKTIVNQVFCNPHTSAQAGAIEVQYKFPRIKDAIVTRMVFTLDDRTIETLVEVKEKAEQKYDDALAAGNMAIKMNESEDHPKFYEIDIGNIKPGQKVQVEIHLVAPLAVVGGAFDYNLPLLYFPRLKNVENPVSGQQDLNLELTATIQS